MAQTKYTCKDCVLLNDEDSEFPYCLGKDLYTYTNPDDDAWEFLNQIPRLKAKDPVIYRCSICNKFHISIHHKNNKK